MRVRVLFFGMLKEFAGKPVDELDLREGASVHDLLGHYQALTPKLGTLFPSIAVAVNQQYASTGTILKANDEIALLPPVSGGAGELYSSSTSPERGQRAFIVRERVDTDATIRKLKRGEDGAVLAFEGIVRNQTRKRQTLYLDYEAYEEMALKEMEALASRALDQFQVRDVAIVHRLGRLEIGETSVLIAVASAHRAACFEACRWLIDTLKRKVPIWKKEYFVDGAVWADGEPFPEEILRAES